MAIVYFMKETAVNHKDEGDFCEGVQHGFVPNPSELPCCLYCLKRQYLTKDLLEMYMTKEKI